MYLVRQQSTCAANAHHSSLRLSGGDAAAAADTVSFLFVSDLTLSKPTVSEKRAQHTA